MKGVQGGGWIKGRDISTDNNTIYSNNGIDFNSERRKSNWLKKKNIKKEPEDVKE